MEHVLNLIDRQYDEIDVSLSDVTYFGERICDMEKDSLLKIITILFHEEKASRENLLHKTYTGTI